MSSLKKCVDWKKKIMNIHCMYFSTLIYTCSVQKTNVYWIWGLPAMWIIYNTHYDSFDLVFSNWFFQDRILTRFLKFKIVGRFLMVYIKLLAELLREQSQCCLSHVRDCGSNLCTTVRKNILDSFVLLSCIHMLLLSFFQSWGPWYI